MFGNRCGGGFQLISLVCRKGKRVKLTNDIITIKALRIKLKLTNYTNNERKFNL